MCGLGMRVLILHERVLHFPNASPVRSIATNM
jgi:hypothetical protein